MNSLSKIALFTLLSGAVFAAQAADPHAGMVMHEQPAAAQAQSIRGKGVIKAIDMDNKKITIAHEAIPAVNWPPMTMRFTITPMCCSTRRTISNPCSPSPTRWAMRCTVTTAAITSP